MPVYFIVDVSVLEPDGYQEYIAKAPAMVQAAGGRYLVRGGDPQTIEGEWSPSRMVILEYPSEEAFRSMYDSPEYQAILPQRLKNTHSNAILVQGAPPMW